MYDEFRDFALEDASTNISELGLTNLIKFYGAALLSSQSVIRTRVARDYVQLVRTENEHRRPAFKQLQSVMRNELLEPQNRQQIYDFLDAELWAALE
jgi:la-related protein 1